MTQSPTAEYFVFSLLFCSDLASETPFQRWKTSLLHVKLTDFIKRLRVSKGSAKKQEDILSVSSQVAYDVKYT